MKKRNILLAAMLFATASILAFSTPVAKADAQSGTCNHIGGWVEGPSGEGWPCMPFYSCPSPAAWPYSDKCYAHWGVPDAPNPCD